jgi:carboxymethylenebutenolidase
MTTPALITLESKVDGFGFTALHAQAQGRRRGGVIVLQEIFGLDRFVQADVERWSRLGFEVLAPSLFDRQEPGFTAEHDADGVQQGFRYAGANGLDNPVDDVATCADVLLARGPVFVVGYCYGGGIAWLAAAKVGSLAAASAYYGGMIGAQATLKPQCPVILHFGAEDAHIPLSTVEVIRAAQPDVPVHVYDGAGHGFNNAGGHAYHASSADLARHRTLALFAANGAD